MPLQDLTPQLRTRLNRMERSVGWFITLATALLLFGLGYYLYNTAEDRGWFKTKAFYYTYTDNGSGLKVGDTVKLMGKDVGYILEITPMPPTWGRISTNNFFIRFEVTEPNFGYIWTEGSMVQIKNAGFLSQRELNVSKGTVGIATFITQMFRDNLKPGEARALPQLSDWHLGENIYDGTNLVFSAWQPLTNVLNASNYPIVVRLLGTNNLRAIDAPHKGKNITAMWNRDMHYYQTFNKKDQYELDRYEEPVLTDRLQAMVGQIQSALPGILALTNQLVTVLSNATQLTSNFNIIAENARPAVTNLASITAHLTNENGSLGQWLIPTNLNQQLAMTLQTARGTLTNVDSNLISLNMTLTNVANITSNLNNQVQANTNILSNVSDIVVHTDQFIQGLKKFWLFKHLFTAQTNKVSSATSPKPKAQPLLSPKAQTQQN